MLLAFGSVDRGAAPEAEPRGAELLAAKRDPESPAFEERLMEEICQRVNLRIAWKRVRRNKGSPGVDGMTIAEAADYLREHWPTLRTQLLNGSYQPLLQKRWDRTFSEHSYGFRPGRSAHQAVAQAQRYVAAGYRYVVDIDLAQFLDESTRTD